MNDFSAHVTKTRFEALHDLLKRCEFHPDAETVPLERACGRVLAADIVARNTLPNALTAALDSIAVRFADFAKGMPDTSAWTCGREYVFSNTGIGIDGDFDTCIAIEQVRFDDDGTLRILRAPERAGEATIAVGASMRAGDVLMEAGRTVTPVVMALAAQGGCMELSCVRKPRVAFIPSGNELVAAGEPLPPRKNVESNSIMIAAKLGAWGAEPVVNEICPDKWDIIKAALEQRIADCDIVVVNAGSSKGTDDLTIEILEEMGHVLNHEFAHGPGRHSSLSIVDGTPVIGISGPPVGAEFCADWYVKPVVDAYFGRPLEPPRTLWAILSEDVPARPRPIDIVRRVRLVREDDGMLIAQPLPPGMKPALRMCAEADGFLVMKADCEGFRAGDQVAIELRYPYTLPA